MDRISNLPCNVIDDIIKRLTLRDAARTSILSREWRYKWLSIPYLVFDQKFQWNLPWKLREKYTIASIIHEVLSLHKGSIVKFVFEACDIGGDYQINCWPDVDHWFHFLTKHHIEELSLEFSFSAAQKIPNYLFSFGQLKHLKLEGCDLKPPSSFKGFGRLVVLDLRFVSIEDAELSSFISKCPLLEHLNLVGAKLPYLTIDAPSLKSFCLDLDLNSEIPCVCLKNTAFLEEVSISTVLTYVEKEISERSQINMFELLCQLSSVKKLTLHNDSMLCLPKNLVPLEIPDKSLSQLSRLICDVPFQELSSVSFVVCLIGRTTNLMSLEIRSGTGDDKVPSTEYLKDQQKLKYSLCHLKHVKISDFLGDEPQMEFVKLILTAAKSLVKLELKLHHCIGARRGGATATEKGYRLIKNVAKLHRASTKVNIVIHYGSDIICLRRAAEYQRY